MFTFIVLSIFTITEVLFVFALNLGFCLLCASWNSGNWHHNANEDKKRCSLIDKIKNRIKQHKKQNKTR